METSYINLNQIVFSECYVTFSILHLEKINIDKMLWRYSLTNEEAIAKITKYN